MLGRVDGEGGAERLHALVAIDVEDVKGAAGG
jgi:hypothetical protein